MGTSAGTFSKAAGKITGNIVAGGQTVSFTGGPVAGSLYNYDNPAVLANASGAWTLNSLDGDTVLLNVQSNGNLTATTAFGCSFSGNVASRPSGKIVFDATITFGPSPCVLANESVCVLPLNYTRGRPDSTG